MVKYVTWEYGDTLIWEVSFFSVKIVNFCDESRFSKNLCTLHQYFNTQNHGNNVHSKIQFSDNFKIKSTKLETPYFNTNSSISLLESKLRYHITYTFVYICA